MKSEFSQNLTYRFPSTQKVDQLKKKSYQTLHQALDQIHKSPSFEQKLNARYQLKNFDGKNATLLECTVLGCRSHIIFKNKTIKQLKSVKFFFQIFQFDNYHKHNNNNLSSKSKIFTTSYFCQNFDILMQKIKQQQELKIRKDNSLERLIYELCKFNLSHYFRDYLNLFKLNQFKIPTENRLPYKLPQIMSYKTVQVTLNAGYKCLNSKKKTYFFAIQIFAFGQLFTVIKFITCVKNKNPQIFLYIFLLFYILINKIMNCQIHFQDQVIKQIYRQKKNFINDSFKNNPEQKTFLSFVTRIQKQFDINWEIFTKYQKQSIETQQIINNQLLEKQDHFFYRKLSSEIHQINNKPYIYFILENKKYLYSLKNKYVVAEGMYSQAIRSQITEWHVCEQKPSFLHKLNQFMLNAEIKRLRIQRKNQKTQFNDQNIISISDDDAKTSKQEAVDLIEEKKRLYLLNILGPVEDFYDFSLKFQSKQQKISTETELQMMIPCQNLNFEQLKPLKVEKKKRKY